MSVSTSCVDDETQAYEESGVMLKAPQDVATSAAAVAVAAARRRQYCSTEDVIATNDTLLNLPVQQTPTNQTRRFSNRLADAAVTAIQNLHQKRGKYTLLYLKVSTYLGMYICSRYICYLFFQ